MLKEFNLSWLTLFIFYSQSFGWESCNPESVSRALFSLTNKRKVHSRGEGGCAGPPLLLTFTESRSRAGTLASPLLSGWHFSVTGLLEFIWSILTVPFRTSKKNSSWVKYTHSEFRTNCWWSLKRTDYWLSPYINTAGEMGFKARIQLRVCSRVLGDYRFMGQMAVSWTLSTLSVPNTTGHSF